jgi:hypothetical protein
VSEQLGFPYPIFERPNPISALTDFCLSNGRCTLSTQLFNSDLYQPNTIVSQPVFGMGKQLASTYYDNDYVKSNSYNYEKGVGKIFVTHNNMTYSLEMDEEISFSGITL